MISYYSTLKVLQQELDMYQHVEMESATDVARLANLLKKIVHLNSLWV